MTQTTELLEKTLRLLLEQQEITLGLLKKKLDDLELENQLIKTQYEEILEQLRILNITLQKLKN